MDCTAPSMEFSRQEYRSGLSLPTSGDPPDPGFKPVSLVSPALASEFFISSTTWEAPAIGLSCGTWLVSSIFLVACGF